MSPTAYFLTCLRKYAKNDTKGDPLETRGSDSRGSRLLTRRRAQTGAVVHGRLCCYPVGNGFIRYIYKDLLCTNYVVIGEGLCTLPLLRFAPH